jgi:hypothetical protein
MRAPTLRVARSAPDTVDLLWGSEPRAVSWVVLQSAAAFGRPWTAVFHGEADTLCVCRLPGLRGVAVDSTLVVRCRSATVRGLCPETTYHFRVKAVDAEGGHAVSEPVSALTGRRVSSFFRAAVAAKSLPAPDHLDERDGKEEEDREDKEEEGPSMATDAKEEKQSDAVTETETETKLERVRSRKAAAKRVDGDESFDDDDYVYYDSSSSDE